MEFARDPAAGSAASDLIELCAAEASARCWLLVDAALLDERALRVAAAPAMLTNSLAGSPLSVYGSRAPQFGLLPAERATAAAVVKGLIGIDPRASAISVLRSPSSQTALTTLFAYLAQATVDGDLPVHVRFADTRILPSLLAQLSPAQAARVATDVRGWTWVDHRGRVASWSPPLALATAEADPARHLLLSMPQFDAMMAASEPDTMFSLLRDNTPEVVPAEGRGGFRDQLRSLLAIAEGRSVVGANDRLQFMILGLGFGETFHEDPELQPTWQAVASRRMTLKAAVQAWDRALWKRLESKRTVRR